MTDGKVDKKGGLLAEPEGSGDQTGAAEREQGAALAEAGRAAAAIAGATSAFGADSWEIARSVVDRFRPVPWFIWRIANTAFSKPIGSTQQLPEGLLLGLRRFLFAVASDPILGTGKKVSDVRTALAAVPPDVIAAAAVIHTVSRRLAAHELDRIWGPVLDESVVRARIAYAIAKHSPSGWLGRALLSGFATRGGLAVLLATAEEEHAQRALERFAEGKALSDVGMEVFGCHPHQVSSLLLSAAGCGRDAASAAICYALERPERAGATEAEMIWTALMCATEFVRSGATEPDDEPIWRRLGITGTPHREQLLEDGKQIGRRGHGWPWLI